jgi:type I restriction enzyme S subunit
MIGDWQDAGWPIVRIRDIGRLHGGGTPSRKRSEYFQGTIPWITGQDIPEQHVANISEARDYVTEEAVQQSATRVVPAGAVLVTTRVSVGKTAVAGCPICFSQDVTAILVHSPAIALPEYVAHFLRSRKDALLQKNQGSTIAGITRDSLALEQIPLPPLSEQQRIVEILQEAEEINRLRAQAEAKTAELIPALFHQMFIAHPERNKWPEMTINKVAANDDNSIRTGPFGSDLLHSEFVESGIPVLGIDNAVSNRFRWDERRYITQGKYESLSRFRVYPDDVMVTIMGTVGRCAIAPAELPEAISTKHLCVITPDKSQVLSTFLWASILSDPTIRAQTKAVGKGAIMEGWNSKIIRALKFRLPPLNLQRAFEKQVNETLALEECARTSDTITKNLTPSISAYAFSGQLTSNWREANERMLATEARKRDKELAIAAGKPVMINFSAADPQDDSDAFDVPTELNYDQLRLLVHLRVMKAKKELPRWFTAESIGQHTGGSVQTLRGLLAVLVARGLVLAASQEQASRKDGAPEFGNVYRLPSLRDGIEDSDYLRAHEMRVVLQRLSLNTLA